jgi:hypothetical protein
MDDLATLYRAVRDSELTDIVATGAYRISSGISVEGKYFFDTVQSAIGFAKKMYQLFPHEGPYTLTSIGVSQVVLRATTRLYVAGEGYVVFIPQSALPLGPVQMLDYAPMP